MIYYEVPCSMFDPARNDVARTLIINNENVSRWGLIEDEPCGVVGKYTWYIHTSSENIEIWVREVSHNSFFVGVSAGPETDIVCRRFDYIFGKQHLPKIGKVKVSVYEFDLYREIDQYELCRYVDDMNIEILVKEDAYILRAGFETQADYMEWKLKQ